MRLCENRIVKNVERLPILMRNIYGDLSPYTDQPDKKSWNRRVHGLGDTYIIAAGRRGDVPSRPDVDILMRDMALVWDSLTKKYFLIGLRDFRNTVSNTQEIRLVNSDMKDQSSNRTLKWKKDLGTDPFKLDASGKDKIIHHYGMELRLVSLYLKIKILRDLPGLKMLVLIIGKNNMGL